MNRTKGKNRYSSLEKVLRLRRHSPFRGVDLEGSARSNALELSMTESRCHTDPSQQEDYSRAAGEGYPSGCEVKDDEEELQAEMSTFRELT